MCSSDPHEVTGSFERSNDTCARILVSAWLYVWNQTYASIANVIHVCK